MNLKTLFWEAVQASSSSSSFFFNSLLKGSEAQSWLTGGGVSYSSDADGGDRLNNCKD